MGAKKEVTRESASDATAAICPGHEPHDKSRFGHASQKLLGPELILKEPFIDLRKARAKRSIGYMYDRGLMSS